MDWKTALVDNWPFKVAALTLAVLLWFNVSANEDRTERAVATAVEFDFQDDQWVVVDAPEEVQTVFRGRLGDFFDLSANRPVIRHTLDGVTDSVLTLELNPSMVQYDRGLNVQPTSVRPTRIRIRFERRAEKRVPVTIDLSANAAEGFTILDSPIVQPETVTVRGAESEVESISYLGTEPVDADDLESTTTRQLTLRVPPELGTILVEPEYVLATLRVDSLTERRLRVRLQPVGPAAAVVELRPGSVEIILRGPRSVVEDLAVREMTASVRVDELPEGEARLPVEVSLPEGISVTAEASPTSVGVRAARPPPEPGTPADTTATDTTATDTTATDTTAPDTTAPDTTPADTTPADTTQRDAAGAERR